MSASAQGQVLQVGQILENRYRIVSEDASLDIGTQYKAYDTELDRLVVVLVLASRFGGGPEVQERLAKVQQALTDLNEPALLPAEQIGEIDGQPYVVRSHLQGYALADVLQRVGSLETKAALEVAIRLCDALAVAHRAGLVHGGVSPYSVLVGNDGQVTVTDTGLIPALRPDPAPIGQPWGRFPYISPEQAAGQEIHPNSDVYVVGLLLYQMLAGRPPFRAGDDTATVLQHLRYDPPSLEVLVPDVPSSLAQIVHKALAKEPAARYRNAGQLAHLLRSQLAPPAVSRPSEPADAGRAPTKRQLVVPAPPSAATAYSTEEFYRPGLATDYFAEESAGVDWLMIGLLIVAVVAVLGLIPLWRTVYRRYATPPLAPTPSSYHLTDAVASLTLPYSVHEGNPVGDHRDSQVGTGQARREARSVPLVLGHRRQVSEFGSPDYGLGSNLYYTEGAAFDGGRR